MCFDIGTLCKVIGPGVRRRLAERGAGCSAHTGFGAGWLADGAT